MSKKDNALTSATDVPKPQLFQHTPEFVSKYANNIRFHSTVHDLTLVFGQSDVTGDQGEVIRQHTAITIPWSVVKISLYYEKLNLIIHEAFNGDVLVPPLQIPTALPAPTPEMIASDPNSLKAHEAATRYREDFLATLT